MARELKVIITGDSKQLEQALGKSSKSTETFGTKIAGMGKAAGIAAGAAGLALLTEGLKNSVDIALKDQSAHALLQRAFKNSGIDAGKYAKKIDDAKDSSRELGFKNSDVMTSLAKLIVPTKDVGKAMQDLKVAEDLARAKHIDLGAAVQIVTGALAGNQRAVKTLGIVVPPVTAAVDSLKKAHRGEKGPIDSAAMAHAKYLDKIATGQKIIDTLSEKVRGQSQAYAGTASGGMAVFSAKLDDLQGKIGGALLPVLESVVSFINSNWNSIGTVMSDVWNAAKIPLEGFIAPMKVLWDLIHGDWGGAWDAIKAPAVAAWDAIKGAIQPVIDQITGPLTTAMTGIQATASTVWTAVSGAVSTAFDAIKNAFNTIWTPVESAIKTGMNSVKTTAETVWSAVSGAVRGAFSAAKTAFDTIWNAWYGSLKTELQWVGAAGSTVWSTLSGAVGTAFGAIKGFWNNVLKPAFDAFKDAINWIKDHAGDAFNAIETAVTSVVGPVTSAINSMIGPLKTLVSWLQTAWDWIGKVGGGGGGQHNDPGNANSPVGPGGPTGPKRAMGGYLPGGANQGIPILAHGGEYVIRKSAVDKLGTAFLGRLNSYDGGGPVDPATGVPFEIPLTSAVGSGPAYEIWRQRVKVAKIAKKEARILASRALYNPSMLPTPASRADAQIADWMDSLQTDSLFTMRLNALKSFVDSGDAYRGGAVSRSWLTYGVPKLKTGGYITRGGIAEVHRGETVTPAGRGMGDVHIYLDGKEITSVVESRLVARGRQGQAITARTP